MFSFTLVEAEGERSRPDTGGLWLCSGLIKDALNEAGRDDGFDEETAFYLYAVFVQGVLDGR